MNNYKEVDRLTKVAADSTGSASKRMEIYLDSVEAKTNNVKNAWQGLVQSLNQSESWKDVLDIVTKFLENLQYVDWKTVGETLGLFISLFGMIKTATWISSGLADIKKAETTIARIAAGLSSFAPALVIILGLVTAIAIAVNSINENYDKKINDIDKRIESINKEKEAIESDKKSVEALYNEYTNLESKQKLVGLNADEKQRMSDITKELVEQYGFEYDSVDSLTGGYVLATDALTKYTEAMKQQQKELDAEERKEKEKKVATQAEKKIKYTELLPSVQNLSETAGWGNEGYVEEAGNLLDKLKIDAKAFWNGLTGSNTFKEDYANTYKEYYKNKSQEMESEIKSVSDEMVTSIMDILSSSIENSGLSDRFSSLFTNQLKVGLQNIDLSKLDSEEEVEKLISSYERILADSGLKDTETRVDKTLTEIEKKMADTSAAMNLEDYKKYNQALEEQAGISASLLSNIENDSDKITEIVTKSLENAMSNTGSYFALISDSIEDEKIRKNFDNIANGIINLNDQLADGRINIKEYFNTMKSQIESIDLSNIEKSFGNIGNYLATMGQITNAGGGQLQNIISDMQQGKKLNNAGVDDIKSISDLFGTVYKSMLSAAKDENGNWKSYQYQSGIDKDKNPIYSQGTLQKYFEDTSATDQKVIETLQQKQESVKNELIQAQRDLQTLKNVKEGKENKTNFSVSAYPEQKNKSALDNVQVEGIYKKNYDIFTKGDYYEKVGDNKDKIDNIDDAILEKEKEIAKLQKQQQGYTEDIADEQQKVNKGMISYLNDLEDGVNYLDSFDWDSLDKASDTIFQGFADGALDASSTIDNVKTEYKNAALEMANAFIDMTSKSNQAFMNLGENVRNQMTSLSRETLEQIGLTSNATAEEIANAMLSSNANFNTVVGYMNETAQQALQSVLEGAGGMLEALGTAIEQFTGEIKISIGGVKFNGLKTFISWDGGDLFAAGEPVESSIKFSGTGIDTKSLGGAIKGAGTSLKKNAETLASQWTPIQPNLTKTSGTGGKSSDGSYTPSGGGSKSGSSGSNYSPEDAASDLKDILQDIEDYESDIELDLKDQTEELINHYNLEKNKLDLLREQLDYYDGIYDVTENTSKWLDTQLKILDEESKKTSEIYESNKKIADQREKIYNENSGYNVRSWFDEVGNETLAYGDLLNSFEYKKEAIQKEIAQRMRAEYNKVANSTDKDTISAAKDRIKQIEEEGDLRIKEIEKEQEKVENIYDSVEQLNDAWKENEEAIRDALTELNDRVKSIRDELVDDLMEQLETAVDKMNKSIEKDATRLEQLRSIQESYNDILNDTLDTQDELASELQANMDSYEYLDETMRQLMFNEDDYKELNEVLTGIQEDITGIWEDHYNQINSLSEEEAYKMEYISNETERQLANKQKEYELAKAELDVAKAQTNLQNVLNERNQRVFVNGQWQWVKIFS